MTNTTTKACACGCGREVSGRSHRRYASPTCRVRDHRRRDRDGDPKGAVAAEKALQEQGAVSPPSSANDVTHSDRARVRMDRRSAPTIDSEVPIMAEKALRRDSPVSTHPSADDVTLSDRARVTLTAADRLKVEVCRDPGPGFCCLYHLSFSWPWPYRVPNPWTAPDYLDYLRQRSYCL